MLPTPKTSRIHPESSHSARSLHSGCDHVSSLFAQRKKHIESFAVFHPLLDRLLEIKMAKCFQHGHVRQFQSYGGQGRGRKVVEAPSIQGSMKIFSLRPKTSQIRVNFKPGTSRPRTTNTVIRSRTSQPRIQRKLELISKQPTQFQQEQLKPSLLINKIRRSSAEPTAV